MGMDPLIMFGLGTVGCGAAGWLVGPAIGGAVFNAVKSKYRDQIAIVSALSCGRMRWDGGYIIQIKRCEGVDVDGVKRDW